MANKKPDLISMADIAELAGQRRATVGNWKSRYADFPAERSRNVRGPLYDRAEVVDWLRITNRLVQPSPELAVLTELFDDSEEQFSYLDDPPLILVALALRMYCTAAHWQQFVDLADVGDEDAIDEFIDAVIPFAAGAIWWPSVLAPLLPATVDAVSRMDRASITKVADVLLDRYAAATAGHDGVYLPPPSVRALVTGLARPAGVLYQPGSGMGQLLVDSAAHGNSTSIYAQEPSARGAAIARTNLAIHDLDAAIASADVFDKDAFPDLRADCVVSGPPKNQKIPHIAKMADDVRWVWGEPGPNDGPFAWVQHCLYHLADGGRAVIVLPRSSLSERGRTARIRQRMVKAGLLDAVISLPAGVFPRTAARYAVLVFSKKRSARQGTLMVDLSASQDGSLRSGDVMQPHLIEETVCVYRDWVAGETTAPMNAGVATLDDLAAHDFVIDPAPYQPLIHDTADLEQTIRKIAEMRERLDALIETSRGADDRLNSILKGQR